MKFLKDYTSYQEYLEDQKEKTLQGKKIRMKRFDSKVKKFEERFKQFVIKPNSRILCLGAREGEECVAWQGLGHSAIGIDLVPCPPLVIEGDFNKLKFDNGSFDLVYLNVLDHSWSPDQMFRGIHRVLVDFGLLFVDIVTNQIGDKEVLDVSDTLQVCALIQKHGFVLSEEKETGVNIYKHKKNSQKEISMIFRRNK